MAAPQPARLIRGGPLRNEATQHELPTLLALVVGRRERARVVDAFRGRARVLDVAVVSALRDLVEELTASLIGVVLEPRDADGTPVTAFVHWCARYAPAVPLVAYCDPGADASRDIIDLSRAGVHELMFRGVDDSPARLRDVVDAGLRASAAARTVSLLMPHVPPPLQPLVEYCVYHPNAATTVASVAAGLGVHRKTLVNLCARVGFPPPGFVIGWSRIMHAAVLLSTTRRPVDHIARALEFSTGTAMRNMIRRYTSRRPSELRGHGATDLVLACFLATLRSPAAARPP
jgi:AraC-like DNA-binding protein